MQLDIDMKNVTSDQWQKIGLVQKQSLFFNKIEKRVVEVCNCIWCSILKKSPRNTLDADNDIYQKYT